MYDLNDYESLEDLDRLTVSKLRIILNSFPGVKKTFKDKAELVQCISDLIYRKRVLDEMNANDDHIVVTGEKHQNLEQKRKVFDVEQKAWTDVESLNKTDIPEGFTMDVLLKYLTEYGITINGEEIIDDAEKPADKGRRLHMSNFIKRAWFVKTDTKLLIACNVKQSMGKIMR